MSKAEIVAEFGRSVGDTGSPEVQVAVFTQRILLLTDHLKRNAKDHHSRRGLKMLVGQRQGQLQYLKRQSQERYESLIGILGLRR